MARHQVYDGDRTRSPTTRGRTAPRAPSRNTHRVRLRTRKRRGPVRASRGRPIAQRQVRAIRQQYARVMRRPTTKQLDQR